MDTLHDSGVCEWDYIGFTYPSLLFSLLDGVARYVCVAGVLRWGPFQGSIEAPCVNKLDASWGTWKLCRTPSTDSSL